MEKREGTSKIGVVFVISVLTVEVLDYAVKTMVCAECKAHKNDNDFELWYEGHANKCQINHEGSSGSMEAVGAVEIFSRSIATRQLKYTKFVRDGDSSCYGKIAEEMKKNYDERRVCRPCAKKEWEMH